MSTITVSTIIDADIDKVWKYWNEPEHIEKWAFASNDWEAKNAKNDLTVGGKFSTTMRAKDGSASFEFGGTYTAIKEYELIEYKMDDGRKVSIEFKPTFAGTHVTETFDPESENSEEMQKSGWQAILDNFKKHVEA